MARKANRSKRQTPAADRSDPPAAGRADPPTYMLPGDPRTSAEHRQSLHGKMIAALVYSAQLTHMGDAGGVAADTAFDHAGDLIERMKPRDPLEEMLCVQAMWTHARLAHLSRLANQQENLDTVKVVHDYCDRAANTFRRLMLALREYRRPARPSQSFTAIKQANVAQQQVIQNAANGGFVTGTASNEQASGTNAGERPQALPADRGRAAGAAGVGTPRPAVEAIDRTANGGG